MIFPELKPLLRALARMIVLSAVLAVGGTGVAYGKPGKGEYPADYRPPIAYGKDFVAVTAQRTLGVRYRAWDDVWGRNLASYLADARARTAARGTKTKKVTFAAVFVKNAEIICPNHMGGDGKPMRGTWSISEEEMTQMRTQAKMMSDFFYAASSGEVTVDWVFPVVDGLKIEAPNKPSFLIWPRGLADQLLPKLKRFKDSGVIMWIFLNGRAKTLNPIVDQSGKKKATKGIGRGPLGISWTAWPLYGGYCQSVTWPSAGLWVHEFNHRYLDGLKTHEGIPLTANHGLGKLGLAPGHRLDETYFNTYLHIIRPAMWRRFSITTPNKTPREPFSGKAYAWADVRDDCWFKLPELHKAELAKLTGVDSIETDTRQGWNKRLFRVGVPADRAKVLSRYIDPPPPPPRTKDKARKRRARASTDKAKDTEVKPLPVQLDNLIDTSTESCAVLRTATAQWLFVKANVVDLYVDMLKISGRAGKPLPVYGWVNEGVLPLLVIKAPPDMPMPVCEEGYFRAPAAEPGEKHADPGHVQGLHRTLRAYAGS